MNKILISFLISLILISPVFAESKLSQLIDKISFSVVAPITLTFKDKKFVFKIKPKVNEELKVESFAIELTYNF